MYAVVSKRFSPQEINQVWHVDGSGVAKMVYEKIEEMGAMVKQPLVKIFVGIAICVELSASADAQTIGDGMAKFLKTKLNTRVGGGECSHMATEALRVSGGEFFPTDFGLDDPSTGDYVRGTLVTVISCTNKTWTDSDPQSASLVGDIIQYNSAVINHSSTPHHTSVVAAVNTAGRPTPIYQQNFNSVRRVQQASIDTTRLTSGWLRIYRPIPVVLRSNEWKITVTNNSSSPQTYSVRVGTSVLDSITLTAANTKGSFTVHRIATNGTVPNLLNSTGYSLFLQTSKGNQITASTTTGGAASFQQLNP